MVFCKITAAICKHCNAVNFPGCREHRELLTNVYAKDEVHTACGSKKCTTNSYASKFPCVSCKGTLYDVYRMTVAKEEVAGTISAFHKRAGGKAVVGMCMDTVLIACTGCSCLVFPVIKKNLCVLTNGQLLDCDDQLVDLAAWKAKLPHCQKNCMGSQGVGPFAQMEVRLDFGELRFLYDMLRDSKEGKWKEFFFEGRHEDRTFVTMSPPTQPFKGGPIYSPEAAISRVHPVAIGICRCCNFTTFAHCIRHSTLFTKARVCDDPRSVFTSCPVNGCGSDTDTDKAKVKCRTRKRQVEWAHVLLSKTEATYLKKAWSGRGLHFHSSLTFATRHRLDLFLFLSFLNRTDRLLIHIPAAGTYNNINRLITCKHCKSVSFPGVEEKLCEAGNCSSVSTYKYSHTHVAGCPGLGSHRALAYRDATLVGDEVEVLLRYLANSATGSWSEEVLRFGDVDPSQSTQDSPQSVPSPAGQVTLPHMPYPTGYAPHPQEGYVFIDPATGATMRAIPAAAAPPPVAAVGGGYMMAPHPQAPPQLYPTLPYGMASPQNQADYNPFMMAPGPMPMGGDGGGAGYPPTAAFGSMSLGSSSSGVAPAPAAVGGYPTLPRHNPAFPPSAPPSLASQPSRDGGVYAGGSLRGPVSTIRPTGDGL